ncbi:hypothetical protein BKA70DRAFT_1366841 [Coprinopsis sp. MPI-PUGE-AT-0042]|nr:hypothetical protein BKA70DRAFT_1366841 [Coprinopsis sp. MPI-PUGE-AT-0042]
MIANGFHFVRAVFFALLALLSLLTLGFAGWHVSLATNSGITTPTAAILTLFESSTMLFCILLGLVEFIFPYVTTSLVIVELCWSLLLSFFQLGSAIGSVLEGYCGPTGEATLCGSATLYSHTIWLKVIVSFAYFFTFLIAILSHRRVVKGIFSQSICSVEWFNEGQAHQVYLGKNTSWEKDDIESTGSKQDLSANILAPWAQERPLRRGVDAPFAVASNRSSPSSPAQSKVLPALPALRLSTPEAFSPSRFVERFRESRIVSRFETPSDFGKYMVKRDSHPFPSAILDHDKPIPKAGCEWLRADAMRSAH